MAAHTVLHTAKRMVCSSYLLFDCYLDLIPPTCVYHYCMLDFFSRHSWHLSLQFCVYPLPVKPGIQSLHSLLVFILSRREMSIHSSQKQSFLASQVSIAFLWIQRNLHSKFLLTDSIVFFLLRYIYWTPSSVVQIFWALTYLCTCIIIMHIHTDINIRMSTHVVFCLFAFFLFKVGSCESHVFALPLCFIWLSLILSQLALLFSL